MATPAEEDKEKYQSAYQPTLINVEGRTWDNFGNSLIFFSTTIMILQNLHVGPAWIWTLADNLMTVLFTIELLVRVLEKGFLFVVEEGKYWNFFDTLVVTISVGSMIITMKAAGIVHHASVTSEFQRKGHHHHRDDSGGGGGGAASKLKVLRVLRLLRLLRLLRVLKGIEKVTSFVDVFLKSVAYSFIGIILVVGVVGLIMTMIIALGAGGKAWLVGHVLPALPKVDW